MTAAVDPLRLGTRASALAITQSGLVADLIRQRLGRDVELVEITTEGDVSSAPLATDRRHRRVRQRAARRAARR